MNERFEMTIKPYPVEGEIETVPFCIYVSQAVLDQEFKNSQGLLQQKTFPLSNPTIYVENLDHGYFRITGRVWEQGYQVFPVLFSQMMNAAYGYKAVEIEDLHDQSTDLRPVRT